MHRLLPTMAACLWLLGCSGKPPAPKAERVATPFDALQQDRQRASDVQKTVDAQAEQQRRQLEQATP